MKSWIRGLMKLDEAVGCLDTCGVEKTKNQMIFDMVQCEIFHFHVDMIWAAMKSNSKVTVKSRTMVVS